MVERASPIVDMDDEDARPKRGRIQIKETGRQRQRKATEGWNVVCPQSVNNAHVASARGTITRRTKQTGGMGGCILNNSILLLPSLDSSPRKRRAWSVCNRYRARNGRFNMARDAKEEKGG